MFALNCVERKLRDLLEDANLNAYEDYEKDMIAQAEKEYIKETGEQPDEDFIESVIEAIGEDWDSQMGTFQVKHYGVSTDVYDFTGCLYVIEKLHRYILEKKNKIERACNVRLKVGHIEERRTPISRYWELVVIVEGLPFEFY